MKRTFNAMENKLFHQLDEPFRARVLKAAYRVNERIADDPTCQLVIRDAYRFSEEQFRLWKIGRFHNGQEWIDKKDPMEPTVTKAPPGRSAHEYRRAIHLVLIDVKTREWLPPNKTIKKVDKRWYIVGEEATAAGLKWGGDFQDYAHVEAQPKDWKKVAALFGWAGMTPKDRYDEETGIVKLDLPDV